MVENILHVKIVILLIVQNVHKIIKIIKKYVQNVTQVSSLMVGIVNQKLNVMMVSLELKNNTQINVQKINKLKNIVNHVLVKVLLNVN